MEFLCEALTDVRFWVIFVVLFASFMTIIIHMQNKIRSLSSVKYSDDFIPLSFEQCEEILGVIITDVYNNKYYLHYRLKDIKVIPKMDQEIVDITKEILDGMSPHLKKSFAMYYTDEYLVSMITRRVQALLVQYTNDNKPMTK